MPAGALPVGIARGEEFDTVTIDVPIYLHYLCARFLAKGGTTMRGSVQHIDQILEGGPYLFHTDYERRIKLASKVPVDGLIICTGLGARSLGGVEDRDVYPTRGQTVILKAPWVKTGRTSTGKDWSYIIPRRSGEVVVGGVKEVDDW
jgi:glycine/D-amino acid oxidase-like deaminating enzyme